MRIWSVRKTKLETILEVKEKFWSEKNFSQEGKLINYPTSDDKTSIDQQSMALINQMIHSTEFKTTGEQCQELEKNSELQQLSRSPTLNLVKFEIYAVLDQLTALLKDPEFLGTMFLLTGERKDRLGSTQLLICILKCHQLKDLFDQTWWKKYKDSKQTKLSILLDLLMNFQRLRRIWIEGNLLTCNHSLIHYFQSNQTLISLLYLL